MGNIEKYENYVMAGILTLSALLGMIVGYFVFGPIQTSAIDGINDTQENVTQQLYTNPSYNLEEDISVGFNFATYAMHESALEELGNYQEPEIPYLYIVTTNNGHVAIYYATTDGKGEGELREITSISVSGLPPEERERLSTGIPVLTEEALIRILEAYGS